MRLESAYGNCSFPAKLKSLLTTHPWHVLFLVTRDFSFTKFRDCHIVSWHRFPTWHHLNFRQFCFSKYTSGFQVKDCPNGAARSLQGPTTVHSFNLYLHMPFITGPWNCNELNKCIPKWVIKLPEYIMASSYWRSVLKHNCDVEMKKVFTFLNVQSLRNMSIFWSMQYLLPHTIYIYNHKYNINTKIPI